MVKGTSVKEGASSRWQWERISRGATLCCKEPDFVAEDRLSEDDEVGGGPNDEVGRWKNECQRLRKLVERLNKRNEVLVKRLTGLGWSCE